MSSKGCWVAWPKKYFGLLVTLHLFHYKYMYIFFCELISRNANGMKEVTAKKKLTQSFYVLPPLYEKLQRLTGTNFTILNFIFTFFSNGLQNGKLWLLWSEENNHEIYQFLTTTMTVTVTWLISWPWLFQTPCRLWRHGETCEKAKTLPGFLRSTTIWWGAAAESRNL